MKKIMKAFFVLMSLMFLVAVIMRKSIFSVESVLYNLFEENTGELLSAKLLRVIAVVCGAFLALQIVQLIKAAENKLQSGLAKTITSVLKNTLHIVIWIAAAILFLSAIGIEMASIFAELGVLTLVIGVGARDLIGNIISGIFIMIEGSYKIGDTVVFDGWRGEIIQMGLRNTLIVDTVGNVNIVNNSEITSIVNNSKDRSSAFCEFPLNSKEKLEKVEKIVRDNLHLFKENVPGIKDGPYYRGLSSMSSDEYTVYIEAFCDETQKYKIERGMLRECKLLIERYGLNLCADD